MTILRVTALLPGVQSCPSCNRALHYRPLAGSDHQNFLRSAPRRSDRALTLQASQAAHQTVMVMTESSELEIGTPAPAFELLEPLTGDMVRLSRFENASATLVMFICNHCPFVKHLKAEIASVAKDFQPKNVAVIAISSNSVETHPQDGPDEMAKDATTQGYTFPYLYDADQAVAQAYKAMCTPEFYIFDQRQELAYHGRFDESRPKNDKPVTGADVRNALDSVLSGKKLSSKSIPSIGCNIKWHPGKEPSYFGVQ
ncbi:hypothetical protein WJX74_002456 [Apatococcus lobatus]|uniref:Thioredoxin domain-containing protein n=1 Tax=Apatococcus lobatus TaxID=904363 RepID=A0AAW1QIF5_9CHLO